MPLSSRFLVLHKFCFVIELATTVELRQASPAPVQTLKYKIFPGKKETVALRQNEDGNYTHADPVRLVLGKRALTRPKYLYISVLDQSVSVNLAQIIEEHIELLGPGKAPIVIHEQLQNAQGSHFDITLTLSQTTRADARTAKRAIAQAQKRPAVE